MLEVPSLRRAGRAVAVLLAATLALLLIACGEDAATGGFGLTLDKPAGWTYVSGGVSAAHGDHIRYDAAALAQALVEHAGAPLFALLKRAPPQRGFNPTFGITLERDAAAHGQTPVALLTARVAQATAQGAFTVSEAPTALRLSGVAAARAELRGAPRAAHRDPAARVRLYLMVVDGSTLLAAATDAVSGDDDASLEFQQIIDSLRLPGAPTAP